MSDGIAAGVRGAGRAPIVTVGGPAAAGGIRPRSRRLAGAVHARRGALPKAGDDLHPCVVTVAGGGSVPGGRGAAVGDRRAGQPEAIAVGVAVVGNGGRVVDLGVAVVIEAIADLGLGRVDVRVVVVAVVRISRVADRPQTGDDGAGGCPEAIAIVVEVPGGHAVLVDRQIAIVVEGVAELWRADVDVWAKVVAVVRIVHVAGRLAASGYDLQAAAPQIHVGVAVVDVRHELVDAVLAVVVDAVAHLGLAGITGGTRGAGALSAPGPPRAGR